MAAVKKLLHDSPRSAVMHVTNDAGTAVTIDISVELAGAPAEVLIERIISSCAVQVVDVMWDATADMLAWKCAPGWADVNFEHVGGLRNTSGAGKTGDIILNSSLFGAGAGYSLMLYMTKR